ncbi:MAG TPA: AAA family ATPase [Candidatus Hydrogenedentes bacterium]|nr:AAA family ATPase [Candidatus Hydrogenedentota bacterium]HQH53591.1 AAA family ATPase [Candidatus Hydrogenedentota bacterium]HQM49892.1 AAA family ATPase [Candidatus Hydrogenedentota bacterium]
MEDIDSSQALLSFFGLQKQPFAATADPMYFYATREHKECLFRLWNSIDERNGIAVVLGHYGTGKTTLLRKVLSGMRAKPDRYNVAVIGSPIPSWTSFSLLEGIVSQFGLQPEPRSFAAYMGALNQYLLKHHQRINTLVVDDAQNLNKRGQLELLRLVQNLETPHHKLLNLVFFAQLEWLNVLRAAPNFSQRVNTCFNLGSLSLAETRGLIDFRLRQAGAVGGLAPVFDEGAVRTVHAYAQGSPRETVTVCRNALLLAAQVRTRQVGQAIILNTIRKTTLPDPERHSRLSAALQEAPETSKSAVTPEDAPEPERFPPRHRAQSVLQQRANRLLLNAEGNRGDLFAEEP